MATPSTSIVNQKIDALGDFLIEWALDGRTQANPFKDQGYFLADFRSAVYVVMAYLAFVAIGSRVMSRESAQPVNLYMIKFFYNVVQVMLCSWMSIQSLVVAYQHGYNKFFPCNKFCGNGRFSDGSAMSGSYNGLPPMGFVLYVFYLSKVLDFCDTIFIILSKNFKQLSFLHWYHHASIFMFYWYNLNAGYDGDVYLTIVLNGLIHAIMYTYYFVSMHMAKDSKIWWKPALTASQMIQFMCMNAQAIYLITTKCKEFPINIVWAYLYYIMSLFMLFGHFALKEYMPKQYKALMKVLGVKVEDAIAAKKKSNDDDDAVDAAVVTTLDAPAPASASDNSNRKGTSSMKRVNSFVRKQNPTAN